MAWGGVPPACLLLRHTVCAPRHRVVRGCICCAPGSLLFLHCCVDLRDNDPPTVSKVVCPRPPRTCLVLDPGEGASQQVFSDKFDFSDARCARTLALRL